MPKYIPVKKIDLKNRKWPANSISKPPIWCSVDLRDGNQALSIPMNVTNKLAYFDLLVKIGFKEIEVGFPSASQTEFDFVRRLIDEKRIPDDVSIQVLCQARESLIVKTMQAVSGATSVIFHLYNSTSPSQLKYTYTRTEQENIDLATSGVLLVKKYLKDANIKKFRLEYSPENFNETDCDYAISICEAVMKTWDNCSCNKMIINLPTSMENATPNIFADQVEYFSTHLKNRDSIILSVHTHNDRGTGTASAELALLAGAERVEGTLFGNGERTGNLDLVTLSLNMFSQGIKTNLDFSHILEIRHQFSTLTGMPIYQRQPYAGDLVFTAFSGSHQDAIRKALAARRTFSSDALWDVPYLIIDPHDVGREYEELIRINSQSGKGGAAWVLEQDFGITLPKGMHRFLGDVVTAFADKMQRELSSTEIYNVFVKTWLETTGPLKLLDLAETHIVGSSNKLNGQAQSSNVNDEFFQAEHMQVLCRASISWNDKIYSIGDKGNGPLDAFVSSLKQTPVPSFTISAFHEHSIGSGSDTDAYAYIEITTQTGNRYWGCGRSSNIGRAGIDGVISAVNQMPINVN